MDFWDEYEHFDSKITYILESIIAEKQEEIVGCECVSLCVLENCTCLQRSGAKYDFENRQQLETYQINIFNNDKPVYECNSNCKCKRTVCGNKLVQFGPRKSLEIFQTTNEKGFGLRTKCRIAKNVFVCEYAGEILNETEAKTRFEQYNRLKLNMNYIFCINERFGETNRKTYIDPTNFGNIGRYINHSCAPNCNLIPIRIDNLIPKLCIFTQRDVEADEEITYNYGPITNCSGNQLKKCLCQAENCRGFLPFDCTI